MWPRVRVTRHIARINDDLHRGIAEDLFGRDSPRLFIIVLAPLPIAAPAIFQRQDNRLSPTDTPHFSFHSRLPALPRGVGKNLNNGGITAEWELSGVRSLATIKRQLAQLVKSRVAEKQNNESS